MLPHAQRFGRADCDIDTILSNPLLAAIRLLGAHTHHN
jgi:hypothetical protein